MNAECQALGTMQRLALGIYCSASTIVTIGACLWMTRVSWEMVIFIPCNKQYRALNGLEEIFAYFHLTPELHIVRAKFLKALRLRHDFFLLLDKLRINFS